MAERDVTRNNRGQIISYEIDGVSDSTQDTPQYGKVFLPTIYDAYGSTKTEKLNRQSLQQTIDITFSDELLVPNTTVSPQININEILEESDFEFVSSGTPGEDDGDQDDGQGLNDQGNN